MVTEEIIKRNAERIKHDPNFSRFIEPIISEIGPYTHEKRYDLSLGGGTKEEIALKNRTSGILQQKKIRGEPKPALVTALENRGGEQGITHIFVGNVKVKRSRGVEYVLGSTHPIENPEVGAPAVLVRVPLEAGFWKTIEEEREKLQKEWNREVGHYEVAKHVIEKELREQGINAEATVGTYDIHIKTPSGEVKTVPTVNVILALAESDPEKAIEVARHTEEVLRKLSERAQ